MVFKLLKVGHCFHPEAIVVRGGSWKSAIFPAIVTLIQHPAYGNILFDTGYADRFHTVTRSFPERVYRWLTPMELPQRECLQNQLEALDIGLEEIDYVFISHFHADHIAGLIDLPRAKFFCSKSALFAFYQFSGISALRRGFLKALLPNDFRERVIAIEDTTTITLPNPMHPFSSGYDLFTDGSCIAVELPGHAAGHMGLLFHDGGTVRFLLGDACWTADAYTKSRKPNPLAHLILDNSQHYLDTIDKLAKLYGSNQQIQLIPSHCLKTYEALTGG